MRRTKRALFSWLEILLGLAAAALAYDLFLIPRDIAPGGFTGIGQLVNAFTGWPVGAIALCLNIPLFAVTLKWLGPRFGARSLAASIGLSLLIDWIPPQAATADPMLAALFGGVLGGAGFGLILRGGATTGGTDMLAKLISSRIPVLKVGALTFCVDALVIAASGFVYDATSAMLALVSSFMMTRVMDIVLEGPNLSKAYTIVSAESDKIAERIMREMDRGVTGLHGMGMYSGEDKRVLLCVVNRLEAMRLRSIVAEIDPNAFVVATDAREVLGEGFAPHHVSERKKGKN